MSDFSGQSIAFRWVLPVISMSAVKTIFFLSCVCVCACVFGLLVCKMAAQATSIFLACNMVFTCARDLRQHK